VQNLSGSAEDNDILGNAENADDTQFPTRGEGPSSSATALFLGAGMSSNRKALVEAVPALSQS
jgi:hypothetical protein